MSTPRYLQQQDAAVLSRLAAAWLRAGGERARAGTRLAEVLASAILLPESVRPPPYAALYSHVSCRHLCSGEREGVFIACPQDANLSLAQVSLLSPLALAVLGRASGSVVDLEDGADGACRFEILDVTPPVRADWPPHRSRSVQYAYSA
ncbi:GreA/GreB family elongation factor [Massilia sp.]|uniref:GreA/GreB family elongation factor n=1 Tax=Massilia sp. TaxID=1882437 RepID=UPI002899D53C|nr:GreA/GreB family elongation factor [Massilia sp.]